MAWVAPELDIRRAADGGGGALSEIREQLRAVGVRARRHGPSLLHDERRRDEHLFQTSVEYLFEGCLRV